MKKLLPYAIGGHPWPGLSKLIEECGEVMQVAGKVIATGGEVAHWDGTRLDDRLMEELGDLQAAINFVVDHCAGLSSRTVAARSLMKLMQFRKWHEAE